VGAAAQNVPSPPDVKQFPLFVNSGAIQNAGSSQRRAIRKLTIDSSSVGQPIRAGSRHDRAEELDDNVALQFSSDMATVPLCRVAVTFMHLIVLTPFLMAREKILGRRLKSVAVGFQPFCLTTLPQKG